MTSQIRLSEFMSWLPHSLLFDLAYDNHSLYAPSRKYNNNSFNPIKALWGFQWDNRMSDIST